MIILNFQEIYNRYMHYRIFKSIKEFLIRAKYLKDALLLYINKLTLLVNPHVAFEISSSHIAHQSNIFWTQ